MLTVLYDVACIIQLKFSVPLSFLGLFLPPRHTSLPFMSRAIITYHFLCASIPHSIPHQSSLTMFSSLNFFLASTGEYNSTTMTEEGFDQTLPLADKERAQYGLDISVGIKYHFFLE